MKFVSKWETNQIQFNKLLVYNDTTQNFQKEKSK